MSLVSSFTLKNSLSYFKPIRLSSAEVNDLNKRLNSRDSNVRNVAEKKILSPSFMKRAMKTKPYSHNDAKNLEKERNIEEIINKAFYPVVIEETKF